MKISFFGLNTRQFICSVLAVGGGGWHLLCLAAVCRHRGNRLDVHLGRRAVCGLWFFFTYHGMTAEQVLWTWFKSEILCPKRLMFKIRQLLLRSHAARHPCGHETKERFAYEEKKTPITVRKPLD